LTPSNRPDLYKEAGVDVAKGDELVEWLQNSDSDAKSTRFGAKVSGIGGFAALFRPNFSGLKDPLLISSTDGVGTKVLLGIETGILSGLGLDLVGMCVNDLYTLGGRPLFFLDYFATGRLDEHQFKQVLTGIKQGCTQSGALLLGGETAEMPGLYGKGHFDLAGFVVGVVDGEAMLGPKRVKVGDVLYALPSSGFHSNGYSLVRKWVDQTKGALNAEVYERLMTPTRIYHEIPELLEAVGPHVFHALANITGGGISGNLPRVMPSDVICQIDSSCLPIPRWMAEFIEAQGTTVLEQEAVFNLGCGMIAAVDHASTQVFEAAAHTLGLKVLPIGHVSKGSGEPRVVFDSKP
jgi:phosphoribosylformylglycinamidine cyclo-ligase